ncbi:hypothetical protein TTHT_1089 [Thermotomaculum hydrothermale]|uniref:Putative zinc-finger domain-containing protein n=1 Tax=Thermotomaculum hydrothermale TaxID=981385 RepID=A0A7R6SYJ4_9BACT|nr:zf-HC2 domain-containing protein [Thermotomaculum hydrothermale]BBB32626.1 hypothetical protein TTHT_1089 [Thermotomaculum hydrothermale]
MNCKEIQKLIPLYLKGLLDENKKIEIEKHIALCKECTDTLRLEKQIEESLSEFFEEEFEKATPLNIEFKETKKETFLKFSMFNKLAIAIAASFFIAFIIFLSGKQKNKTIKITTPVIRTVQFSSPIIKDVVFIDGKLKTRVNKVGDNIYMIKILGGRND